MAASRTLNVRRNRFGARGWGTWKLIWLGAGVKERHRGAVKEHLKAVERRGERNGGGADCDVVPNWLLFPSE